LREPLHGEAPYTDAGFTGERNRRQERRRDASPAGTRAAARGPARRERRSAATAWGEGGADLEVAKEGREEEEQQETAKETPRETAKASFSERGGDLNRKRSIPCSSNCFFLRGTNCYWRVVQNFQGTSRVKCTYSPGTHG
jgi:hypothetical protein